MGPNVGIIRARVVHAPYHGMPDRKVPGFPPDRGLGLEKFRGFLECERELRGLGGNFLRVSGVLPAREEIRADIPQRYQDGEEEDADGNDWKKTAVRRGDAPPENRVGPATPP